MSKRIQDLQQASIVIRGAGEKASAIAHRLHADGFPRILMTETAMPKAERRAVAFSEAVACGSHTVEGITAVCVPPEIQVVESVWQKGRIAVAVDPGLAAVAELKPEIVIDAVMAKRNTGTHRRLAPLVIAIGPGFTAGRDVHVAVETNPASPHLGRCITSGACEADTGVPTSILGMSRRRLLRSPADGLLRLIKEIGDRVEKGDIIARIGDQPLAAPVAGVVWGVIRNGASVKKGQKLGDIDPRGDRSLCFSITPQAKRIAAGVMDAILGSCPSLS